jgi:hypothetical protein
MIRFWHTGGFNLLGLVLGFVVAFLVVTFLALGAASASAQEQARDLTAQSASVHRASGGAGLTSPSGGAPETIVAGFLRSVGHGQGPR